MKRTIEDITTELIRLPKQDRLEIVRFLLLLDNHPSNTNEVESAWEKEIADRVLAVKDGTAIGIDYDEAIKMV